MFKRKLFLISILVFLILGMGCLSASDDFSDDALEVQTDADALQSTSSPSGDTFNDIQKTVNKAKETDVVILNGTYSGDGNPISIKKSLTFEGVNDATLDGKNTFDEYMVEVINEKFDDTSAKKPVVVFKNIKFINSKQGAVSVASKVSYINCSFLGIRSDFSLDLMGAAIQGDLLTIDGCSFINCSSKWAGAVNAYDAVIRNSVFEDNSAVYGGAIYGSDLKVSDSKFINNRATEGGAIAVDCSPCEVSNCEFESNYAKGYGSSISAYCSDTGNGKYQISVKNSTFSNGKADYSAKFNQFNFNYAEYGNGSVFTYASRNGKLNNYINATFTSCIASAKTPLTLTASKLASVYGNSKLFKVKVCDANKKAAANVYLNVVIYIKNSKEPLYYKTLKTDSKGIASFDVSKLPAKTYRVEIMPAYLKYSAKKATSSIKISKAKATAKAPKVTYKFKKSKYFKVTVKANKKALKNVKIKVKVYTGKKSKTYTIKTNKKGVAKLNTKKLKRGKHKVVISSGNANYKLSAKSAITIR